MENLQELIDYAFTVARTFKDDDEYLSAANLAVAEAVKSFDPTKGRSIRSHVHTYVMQRCLNVQRQELRQPETLGDRAYDVADAPAADLEEIVGQCSYPETVRMAAEGYTQEEIGEASGVSQVAVHKRLTVCRRELELCLT